MLPLASFWPGRADDDGDGLSAASAVPSAIVLRSRRCLVVSLAACLGCRLEVRQGERGHREIARCISSLRCPSTHLTGKGKTMSLRASTSARAIVRTTSRAARLGPVGSTSSLHCTCRCSISTAAVPPPPRPRSTPGSRFHSTVASTRSFATEAESAAFSPQSHIEEHDIVIVGGGPVGLALANALGE